MRDPKRNQSTRDNGYYHKLTSTTSGMQNAGMTVPTRAQGAVAPDTATRRRRSRRLADNSLIAADAPATVRAYTADWTHFSRWCQARGIKAMPASPSLVGEYLADLGEGYARPRCAAKSRR